MNTQPAARAILILGTFLFSTSTFAQTPRHTPDSCKAGSNLTQSQMNECAGKDLRRSELQLDKLLKNLGITNDSTEEKAWEAYRDAELAAHYPQQDIASNGSVYPLCLAILKKKLTDGGIRDLKALTIPEGDTCAGYHTASSAPN